MRKICILNLLTTLIKTMKHNKFKNNNGTLYLEQILVFLNDHNLF